MSSQDQAFGRLRWLAIHFAVFLVVIGAFAVVDYVYLSNHMYVMFAAVLWGAPLSLHVAYVMGLFDIFRKADQ